MSNALIQFARGNDKDIFVKEVCGPISSTGYGIYDGFFKSFVDINKPRVLPEIKDVIFDPPYTIVKWKDGTITKVRCIEENEFNEEIGLAMAISRKYYEVGIDGSSAWCLDKKENKGARAEFKEQVKNAKRPKKQVKNDKKSDKND